MIITQYDGHPLQQISIQLASGLAYADVKIEQVSLPNTGMKTVCPCSRKKWIEVDTKGDVRANWQEQATKIDRNSL
jgi:hypothetical protein